MSALEVFAEGPGWLVVDKAAGLLSTPGKFISDSVTARLEASGRRALAVHRLDMDTSGLMVVATDPEVHRALSLQFQRRQVAKAYLACLAGEVSADEGTIALAFRLDPADRPRQVFDPVHGRLGVTRFRVLDRTFDRTRVRFVPETGRTHQLRLHAAHPIGLAAPILGDPLYGRSSARPSSRLALDAYQLAFVCPLTGQRRHFRRPPVV